MHCIICTLIASSIIFHIFLLVIVMSPHQALQQQNQVFFTLMFARFSDGMNVIHLLCTKMIIVIVNEQYIIRKQ